MDWESETIRHLESETGFPFFHEAPVDGPAEFGTVERDGGSRSGPVEDNPLLTVLLFGSTRKRAAAMAEAASQAILAMPWARPNVFTAEVLSNYRDDDPETGQPRHRVTCRLRVNN